MSPNTQKYIEALRPELLSRYPWAQDAGRLTRFLDSVARTCAGERSAAIDGEAMRAAWKAVGGTGRLTYKALHAFCKS
jgi:hypothetical protein